MSSRDFIFRTAKNYYNRYLEGFQDSGTDEEKKERTWTETIMLAIFFIITLIVYIWASYLLFKCNGVRNWVRVLIFISFHFIPIVSPVAFIIFSYYSPICAAVASAATTAAALVTPVAETALPVAVVGATVPEQTAQATEPVVQATEPVVQVTPPVVPTVQSVPVPAQAPIQTVPEPAPTGAV